MNDPAAALPSREPSGVPSPVRGHASGVRAMAGLFLAGCLAYGIGVYAFTQFLNPIDAEFRWGRAAVGGLMSAFWIAAPFVLVASYAIERLGLRTVVFAGGVIEALGLYLTTRLTSPTEFMLVRFLMGAGKCLVVTPLPIAVARWFPARTGFAFAIALCGWHVGGFVMAPLAAHLIALQGWRTAARTLALILLVGLAIATALMNRPQQLPTAATRIPQRHPAPERAAPLASLAALVLVTVVFYAGYAAFLSQLGPWLADLGLNAAGIGQATGAVAVCAMGGVLLGGFLTQLSSARITTAALLFVTTLLEGAATLLRPGAPGFAIGAFVIPLGLVIGGGDPILIETLRRGVPERHFGRAYGWWYLVCLASLATVPVLIGTFFDRHGSYRGAFALMAVTTSLAALLWWHVAGRGKMTA